eukprot:jgi/Ulvmu1/3284/UM152_0006.1
MASRQACKFCSSFCQVSCARRLPCCAVLCCAVLCCAVAQRCVVAHVLPVFTVERAPVHGASAWGPDCKGAAFPSAWGPLLTDTQMSDQTCNDQWRTACQSARLQSCHLSALAAEARGMYG